MEIVELIILDPSWLSKVMKAIVELDPAEFEGDRRNVHMLRKGVASKQLLMKVWNEFLLDATQEDQPFHHLCMILQAYCLIYPLKESVLSDSENRSEQLTYSSTSSTSKVSERHESKASDLFLVPCMLPPETVEERKDDSQLNWMTFYFNFQKFLPEVIYHRFICQMLAAFQRANFNCCALQQFSRTWCRFDNIHDCNWKIELQRNLHRLKISLL